MTTFEQARQFLIDHRTDYEAAVAGFRWPDEPNFNWTLDWFDARLAKSADSANRAALIVLDTATGNTQQLTFSELSRRSSQVANYLRSFGIKRGDSILLLLGNVVPLWEVMLAAMKLGAIVIPATPLLTADEIDDRLSRGKVSLVVTSASQTSKFKGQQADGIIKVAVDEAEDGWKNYAASNSFPTQFVPDGVTNAGDPMLLYFTSGTTAKPKLVLHSQSSYPVGALSTMYWLGLRPGDVHLNISSPGWAKHAWSSFFAPWNAGATIFVLDQARFTAKSLLDILTKFPITTFCAPPTVWRLLIQEDLKSVKVGLREVCSAGEPLNPEIIDQIKASWNLTIRDGYGQTETTAQVGNSPAQTVKPGAMGRPLPGYSVILRDADGQAVEEGEVCLDLTVSRPAGLMSGYLRDDGGLSGTDGDRYRTGDVAFRDSDGYLTFVGREDDVFKSSDYRISPFELESVLIEHPAVAEAAVVPAPDQIRLSVPKAFVLLAAGASASRETATSIFDHLNARLSPFKRVRRIEFVDELPKTISGKIRRVQLRRKEHDDAAQKIENKAEFREDKNPGERG